MPGTFATRGNQSEQFFLEQLSPPVTLFTITFPNFKTNPPSLPMFSHFF